MCGTKKMWGRQRAILPLDRLTARPVPGMLHGSFDFAGFLAARLPCQLTGQPHCRPPSKAHSENSPARRSSPQKQPIMSASISTRLR